LLVLMGTYPSHSPFHPEEREAPDLVWSTSQSEAFSNMEEIRIRLWLDEQCQDWHVEINGRRYTHVTSQSMEDLIEAAVITAENVIEQATLRGLDRPN
jgi:hypothetical protein